MWLLQKVEHFFTERRYVTSWSQLLKNLESNLEVKHSKNSSIKLFSIMKNEFTCMAVDNKGARRSSFPIRPTFVCTLTSALSSLDSSSCCKKPSSCSPDRLSASFNDVTSLDSTVIREIQFKFCLSKRISEI